MKLVIWGDRDALVIEGFFQGDNFFKLNLETPYLNTSFDKGVKIAHSGLGGIFKLILEVHEALLLFFLPRSFRLHDLFLGDMLSFIGFLLGRS